MAQKKNMDASSPIIIKKYANRRLYNTETSSYITLELLSQMTREGREFVVVDAKTDEDITHNVLTQIIMEEEQRGKNMLPVNFLRQLISMYGDSMQSMVPQYLESSMEAFRKNQEQLKHALHRHPRTGFRRLVSGGHRRGRSGRGIGGARLHGDPPWGYGIWERIQKLMDAGSRRRASRIAISRCSSRCPSSPRRPNMSMALPRKWRSSPITACGRRQGQADPDPESKLEEPLIVRPTSETVIGAGDEPLGAKLARSAAADQPVGQRRALGNAHPHVPAHQRIPLAGRSHRPRRPRRRDAAKRCARSKCTAPTPRTISPCR
jgi:polyhydroxyalkanoate synthesis repressor PhaR